MSMEFTDPDAALMRRIQAGDARAFEELVKRHTRNVLNLVYRYLGDAHRAEDAAQDVFVKVYKARMRYEPRTKFSTWLYRIAVNHCLNEIRAQKSRPVAAAPPEDLVEARGGVTLEAEAARRDLQAAVKAAIDALPENQRMAVLLARYEEMSYDEIAAVMGTSVEAVRALLHRAKEGLAQSLARYVHLR